MSTDYLSVAQLKAAVEPPNTLSTSDDTALYQRAISAASRLIDEWAGRHFWQTATPEARTFTASTGEWTDVDDFHDITGMVLKTDATFDGSFDTTWTVDVDFVGWPFVRVNGWPYTKLLAVGTKRFPVGARRPGVQGTTTWGWGAFPAPVVQACQTLSVVAYKSKDFADVSESDVDSITVAKKFVKPYVCPGGTLYCEDDDMIPSKKKRVS